LPKDLSGASQKISLKGSVNGLRELFHLH